MPRYADSYVITAIVRPDAEKAGQRVWLFWSEEGGGWWQWGPAGWAYRFRSKDTASFKDAMECAPKSGPYFCWPDPATIEVVTVPCDSHGAVNLNPT